MTISYLARQELFAMLSCQRPSGSTTERRWIQRHIDTLPDCRIDNTGNRIIRIGDAPILWSSHTDTVHQQDGYQRLHEDAQHIVRAIGSNCLGADDTAGAWLMRQMVLAAIPGLYIWHRAEEIGGVGSNFIAMHTPELLDGIKAAIAFDRYGTQSIVTHQFPGLCCSHDFAQSLSSALRLPSLQPDPTGTFTDTANYAGIISECTNVSVGYEGAHTSNESLDLVWLATLLDALLTANFSHLVYKRDPEADIGWLGGGGTYEWESGYDICELCGTQYGVTWESFDSRVFQVCRRCYYDLFGDMVQSEVTSNGAYSMPVPQTGDPSSNLGITTKTRGWKARFKGLIPYARKESNEQCMISEPLKHSIESRTHKKASRFGRKKAEANAN